MSSYKVVFEPKEKIKHECSMPSPFNFDKGTIIICLGCGKRYKCRKNSRYTKLHLYWARYRNPFKHITGTDYTGPK